MSFGVKMLRPCLLLTGVIGVFTACTAEPVPAPVDTMFDEQRPVVPPVFTPPKDPIGNESSVRNIARVQYSGLDDRRRSVIGDADAWAAVWQQVHRNSGSPPALPEIDFAKEVVVLASMGTKSSGGHSIEITSVAVSEGRLRVAVRETSPGPGCARTAALTAPAHLVAATRTDGAPVFVEESVARNC